MSDFRRFQTGSEGGGYADVIPRYRGRRFFLVGGRAAARLAPGAGGTYEQLGITQMTGEEGAAREQPTRWSRIETGDYDYLVRLYWEPVRRFICYKLGSADEAEELTQELFLRFIEKDLLARADPSRGRFRSFLFSCVRNFLKNHYRERGTRKGRAESRRLALEKVPGELGDQEQDPRQIFDREWYVALLHRARRAVREQCEARDAGEMYQAFLLYYFGDGGPDALGQKEIAGRLGLSVAQVNNHVHRSRKLLMEQLQALVREYTGSEEDYRQEMAEMAACIERDSLLSSPPPSGASG